MTRTQKYLTALLWGLALAATATFIAASAWRNRAPSEETTSASSALPLMFDVPDFQLIDQDAKPFTRATLAGKPWVASFIFTTCGSACPMMSAKMSKLQGAIEDKDVHLVSITVNPEYDSPTILKEYAKRFSADESRWHFVTGKPDDIYALARAMMLNVLPGTATQPVLHSEKFVLIDSSSHVRAVYDSKDEEQMQKLKTDATALAAEERSGGRHD